MDDNDNSNKPRNRYEERVEAKRERYAERAGKARREATTRSKAARVIMDGIPMGQPILVGHHSERRHRKDIERIDTNLRKAAEAEDKAAHYAHKAETYGTHGISSDDPEAVRKLRAQLAARTETRNAEKLWNRQLKVAAKARAKELGRELTQGDHVALVESLPLPDSLKKGLLSMARAFPWLPQFGNHTAADIRRIEGRIAELERAAAEPEREPMRGTVDGVSYTVEWNKADNRVQIYFPTRPSDAVVEKLKSRGFRWARSVAAWQRQASEGAWYHARWIVGHSEPTAAGKVETITRAPWHQQPWPCGHNDPIYVNAWKQRCACCGAERTDPAAGNGGHMAPDLNGPRCKHCSEPIHLAGDDAPTAWEHSTFEAAPGLSDGDAAGHNATPREER